MPDSSDHPNTCPASLAADPRVHPPLVAPPSQDDVTRQPTGTVTALTTTTTTTLLVLVLALATGIAISSSSSLCAPDSPSLLPSLLHKRLPPPRHVPPTSPQPTSQRPSDHDTQASISTESQPHPLDQHHAPTSASSSSSSSPSSSSSSSATSTDPHPLDTCAAYDDLNLLTRESTAYYAARGGLSRRDFATAVRDCELRNYECFRFQVVHGDVYAVHPIPAAFQSRTLATLLMLQSLADRATARWKRQVEHLGLLPVANLSATWGPKWPYLAPHAAAAADQGLPDGWPAWLPPYPVPNVDAMLHDGDYHHTEAHYWTYSRPVGVQHGWVMPEYALAGWPEAGLQTWIEAHTTLTRLADTVPWSSKNNTLVWRGTNLITLRAQLLRAAPYFEPQDWFDIKSSPAGAKDAYMTMAEQCGRFKYLLYTEGYAQSGRLKYQLSCGSLIVSHPPVYREYWTPLLQSGVHWVVLKDTDWTRLPGVMAQVREADKLAEAAKRNATGSNGATGGVTRDARAVVEDKTATPVREGDSSPRERMYTPEEMAHNAVAFARRVFSQDAMSCQAQAAMWAYRRSINWNQFSGPSKRQHGPATIHPHPNAVLAKQLAREVLGQWMEFSGGRIRRRKAYHKERPVAKRPAGDGKPAGGSLSSAITDTR